MDTGTIVALVAVGAVVLLAIVIAIVLGISSTTSFIRSDNEEEEP